ncbi:hypothetical protein SS50377_22516 [Spironucleus salmonicida]|uniref:Uncharacterized protein n=1 Tax=Spironucleus salmonicida TaxID=348837 RepID=V6LMP6_9EUKA|nr:hypothetical protein SS50377_22516 [Spironucleus salmonicida]|eukprot:EST41994.1 Hypothetical protein SS50377_18299 [Spironucleus salmonicida]
MQCKESGISQQFTLAIDNLLQDIINDKIADNVFFKAQNIKYPSQKYSDAEYVALNTQFSEIQDANTKLISENQKLTLMLEKLKSQNDANLLQIDTLNQQISEQPLALIKSPDSNSSLQNLQIFKQQKSQLVSHPSAISLSDISQNSVHEHNTSTSHSALNQQSITQQSMNQSQISVLLNDISKFTKQQIIISFQTSKLNHYKLLDQQNKIQDYIKIYQMDQKNLEEKETARLVKIEQKHVKTQQKNQQSFNMKQDILKKSQKELEMKLAAQKKLSEDRENQKKAAADEEARKKQRIVDDKLAAENKKIQLKLDAERQRIEGKLTRHKQKLGME